MLITEELLYSIFNMEDDELHDLISNTNDSILLHMIAGNYNWDNGFDIPQLIIKNKYCDLGTALMIFELAEGYILFFDKLESDDNDMWFKFVTKLKNNIENEIYSKKSIQHIPELSRTDKYKMKKIFPDISDVFLDGVTGEDVQIVYIGT
ncbi:MAG: DUF4274 domain-containing protein [Ruminococcus sp.]|nr:DUF4274 domain-containing protein [Ruminococcus sp.]